MAMTNKPTSTIALLAAVVVLALALAVQLGPIYEAKAASAINEWFGRLGIGPSSPLPATPFVQQLQQQQQQSLLPATPQLPSSSSLLQVPLPFSSPVLPIPSPLSSTITPAQSSCIQSANSAFALDLSSAVQLITQGALAHDSSQITQGREAASTAVSTYASAISACIGTTATTPSSAITTTTAAIR